MANEEQVKILKRGWRVWNEWRDENRGTRPDLSGVDLSGADLREANLWTTDLVKTNLRRANLRGG